MPTWTGDSGRRRCGSKSTRTRRARSDYPARRLPAWSAARSAAPTIGTLREDDQLIDVVIRAPDGERARLSNLPNLQIQTSLGRSVPLSQVARIGEVMEEPIIWRRSRTPNLTVRADLVDGMQAPDIAAELAPAVAQLAAQLPRRLPDRGRRAVRGKPEGAGVDRRRNAADAGAGGRAC